MWPLWNEVRGRLQFGDGRFEVARAQVQIAEIGMVLAVPRLEQHCLLERADRGGKVSLVGRSKCGVVGMLGRAFTRCGKPAHHSQPADEHQQAQQQFESPGHFRTQSLPAPYALYSTQRARLSCPIRTTGGPRLPRAGLAPRHGPPAGR